MRIGVLGGGQLGMMLAEAGAPLGMEFRFLDPSPDACARRSGVLQTGRLEDLTTLAEFIHGVSHVTYESENVPMETARWLSQRVPFAPAADALRVSQDRLAEKRFLQSLGVEVAPHRPVDHEAELALAAGELGYPCILKTRRFGYDGRGQAMLRGPEDLPRAWERLGGVPLLLEGHISFLREVSQISVRDGEGRTVAYPLVENLHREGILRESRVPGGSSDSVAKLAQEIARSVQAKLGYVGAIAIEFFDLGDRLVANEMAPRVHNSGHWTIEGTNASQFENHLRALTGMPLVTPEMRSESAWMWNLIGAVPRWLPAIEGVSMYDYGKEPRRNRKVGHATAIGTREFVAEVRNRVLAHLT